MDPRRNDSAPWPRTQQGSLLWCQVGPVELGPRSFSLLEFNVASVSLRAHHRPPHPWPAVGEGEGGSCMVALVK